jgi:hypothetical protein
MKKTNPAAFLPIGMGMGVAIGTSLGVATDNLAVWLPIGIAIGSGFGVAMMGAANAKAKKDSSDGGGSHIDGGDSGSDGGGDGGGGGGD